MKTPEDRFWTRVERGDGCWLWTGPVNRPGGYGYFSVSERKTYVHRFSYELHVGPIPDRYSIDHLCRTQLCVRPDHLEAVTQAENVRRGDAASRGTCEHGNGFPMADRGGCRPCQTVAARERRERAALRAA